MVVRNEKNKFLKEILLSCIEYIDDVLIIDDASGDGTADYCEEILKNVPHKIIKNKFSLFSNETVLRKLQWEETLKLGPDWILFLDADEIFEDSFKKNIKALLASDSSVDVYKFRLFDMWNDKCYRSDDIWNAHLRYEPYLLRFRREIPYIFEEKAQHCGRMPRNVKYLKSKNSDFRLKHLGWISDEIRKEKFNRYISLDPEGTCGQLEQYNSILDTHPNLEEWH